MNWHMFAQGMAITTGIGAGLLTVITFFAAGTRWIEEKREAGPLAVACFVLAVVFGTAAALFAGWAAS
jgi:hypothetical protein